ncbi:hypothetical protein ACFL2J_07855 [Candidatus Omnitrophota bacterium]
MILCYVIFIPLLIISLLLFFKFSPKHIEPNKIKIYNFSTIAFTVVLCIVFSLKIKASMMDGSDVGWWPVLAFIFSLIVSIATIFVSGIIRNFIVFKKSK